MAEQDLQLVDRTIDLLTRMRGNREIDLERLPDLVRGVGQALADVSRMGAGERVPEAAPTVAHVAAADVGSLPVVDGSAGSGAVETSVGAESPAEASAVAEAPAGPQETADEVVEATPMRPEEAASSSEAAEIREEQKLPEDAERVAAEPKSGTAKDKAVGRKASERKLAGKAAKPAWKGVRDPSDPPVPIQQSVTPDYIVCLEDGTKMKMLKRHLKLRYNMSPEEYREKWNLPENYPFIAPNYALQRSRIAQEAGFGRSAGKQ